MITPEAKANLAAKIKDNRMTIGTGVFELAFSVLIYYAITAQNHIEIEQGVKMAASAAATFLGLRGYIILLSVMQNSRHILRFLLNMN